MARNLFGGSSDDYAVDSTGRPIASRRVRFYTSAAMTSEITDLAAGAAGTGAPLAVNTDTHGFWGPVYGPDAVTVMYAGTVDSAGNPPAYVVAVYTHTTTAGGVTSFNTRTGAITLAKADVTGTGLAATDVGADASGAATAAQTASLQKSSNLSDVANAGTARTNLGLGTAATVNTGTTSGTVPLLSTGGVLPIARLATGTPDGTKFVRDDGTLASAASPVSVGVYLPSNWGTRWTAAKAGAGSAPARIAVVGDSVARGYFASNLDTKGWVGLLRIALQAKYGDGGTGFKGAIDVTGGTGSPFQTPAAYNAVGNYWTLAQSFTAGPAKEGPGGTVAQSANNNSAVTYTGRGRYIDIWVLRHPTAGVTNDWTYSIDGAGAVTVTGQGTQTVNKVTIDTGTPGAHQLQVKAPTNSLYFVGARWREATGVRVDNYARQGSTSDLWNNQGSVYSPAGRNSGGDLEPADLVVIESILNDAAGSMTAATFLTNYARYLESVCGSMNGTSFTTQATPPDLLVVCPHLGKFATSTNALTLATQMEDIAKSFGAAFVNLWPQGRNSWDWMNAAGYWSDGSTASGLAGTDTAHPSDAGHAWYYQQLVAAVPALIS